MTKFALHKTLTLKTTRQKSLISLIYKKLEGLNERNKKSSKRVGILVYFANPLDLTLKRLK